jgi:hypothetical protein
MFNNLKIKLLLATLAFNLQTNAGGYDLPGRVHHEEQPAPYLAPGVLSDFGTPEERKAARNQARILITSFWATVRAGEQTPIAAGRAKKHIPKDFFVPSDEPVKLEEFDYGYPGFNQPTIWCRARPKTKDEREEIVLPFQLELQGAYIPLGKKITSEQFKSYDDGGYLMRTWLTENRITFHTFQVDDSDGSCGPRHSTLGLQLISANGFEFKRDRHHPRTFRNYESTPIPTDVLTGVKSLAPSPLFTAWTKAVITAQARQAQDHAPAGAGSGLRPE